MNNRVNPQDLEEELNDYRELYLTKGWKRLMEYLESEFKMYDTITNVITLEELMFQKGYLAGLSVVLRHQEVQETSMDDLSEQG
jgi:hypothetical protein